MAAEQQQSTQPQTNTPSSQEQSTPGNQNATATTEKPQVDTSVLNQEGNQQYNSAAVNLASPGADIPEKQSDEQTGQTEGGGPYQPQTPPPEDASDSEQPSKLQATPPPPPSGGAEVPPQQPHKNGKPWLLIVVVILVLALIGGGAWWYFASQAPDEEVTEEPAPEPEPEPEPSPEPPQVEIEPHTTEDSTPTITGTVDNPDTDITIIVDGREYTATVDDTGAWEATVSDQLTPGTYTIHLSATVDGRQFNDQLVNGLTIEDSEPEQQEETEPEETPTTGPEPEEEEELPNTGPGGSKPPQE